MPAQQRVGGDQPAVTSWPGQGLCDGGEQGPVVVGEHRTAGAATEDVELVTQHDDLEVLGATGTNRQARQPGDKAIQDAMHEASGSPANPLVRPHDRVSGTHRRTSSDLMRGAFSEV